VRSQKMNCSGPRGEAGQSISQKMQNGPSMDGLLQSTKDPLSNCYFAFTHALSAAFSSTPATSVLSFTYSDADLVPGTALNSSKY
jgi:hypothetical protein